MFIQTASVIMWKAARKSDEMLEPYEGKLSRTVLRGESGSNTADPLDYPYEDEDYLADMDIEEDVAEESEGSSNFDDRNDDLDYQDESKGE